MTIIPQICNNHDKTPNRYVRDLRWVVILNNDEIYWQDDDDNQYTEPSAWLRLRQYIADRNKESDELGLFPSRLHIKRILLEFRGNMQILDFDETVEGIFFRKAIGKDWGSEYAQDYFLFGTLRDKKLSVAWWRVPELLLSHTENRDNVEDHYDHIIFFA